MTLSSQTEIHYHYDAEGRLISETNSASGESLRDYVWLGLTPIASFGPANDNGAAEDCTEDLAALDTNIADRTARIETNAARIPELGDLADDKQARIAGHTARIAALGELIEDRQARITALTTRAAALTVLAAERQQIIASNTARIAELGDLISDKQARITALNPENRAERIAEPGVLIVGHEQRIAALTTRNEELTVIITGHEARSAELSGLKRSKKDAGLTFIRNKFSCIVQRYKL